MFKRRFTRLREKVEEKRKYHLDTNMRKELRAGIKSLRLELDNFNSEVREGLYGPLSDKGRFDYITPLAKLETDMTMIYIKMDSCKRKVVPIRNYHEREVKQLGEDLRSIKDRVEEQWRQAA